ncbi:hypothetical protein ACH5RR_012742, partial [Cinchona calisaya]
FNALNPSNKKDHHSLYEFEKDDGMGPKRQFTGKLSQLRKQSTLNSPCFSRPSCKSCPHGDEMLEATVGEVLLSYGKLDILG